MKLVAHEGQNLILVVLEFWTSSISEISWRRQLNIIEYRRKESQDNCHIADGRDHPRDVNTRAVPLSAA